MKAEDEVLLHFLLAIVMVLHQIMDATVFIRLGSYRRIKNRSRCMYMCMGVADACETPVFCLIATAAK